MKMTKFLGKDGLTSTSANHIANIAKEMYQSLETRMDSIRLYSRDYTLAENGQKYRVENESTKEEFSALSESLKETAQLKSLIAWLREGIKAKEKLCSSEEDDKWLKEQVKAGREDLREPEDEEYVDFSKILSEEPVERQARYYALEARCATLGKYVHPDGHFSEARKAYFERKKNPTRIVGSGHDAEINTFSTSFTDSEVDGEFFTLQQEYRSVQAEFNSLKAELDEKTDKALREQCEKIREARKAWILARKEALMERSSGVKPLKVVIPDALKDIYGKVAAVASARKD